MAKKITREEAIQIIREVHGDKYMGVDDIEYVDTHVPFTLICPEHGEFQINLKRLKKGAGCPKCGHKQGGNKRLFTTETFSEKAKAVHGDKYDYSKVDYVNSQTKVCIICPIHGEFWQEPVSHLRGQGCPKCGNITNGKKRSLNTTEFIKRAREKHGDKYDYSKVEYVNSHTPVKIICPTHGEFLQGPQNHLGGQGCSKCAVERIRLILRDDKETFIKKAREIHGDKYDYSKVEYVNSKTKVCVICPKHGEFSIIPNNLLMGHGCPLCAIENIDSVSNVEIEIRSFLESFYKGKILYNVRNIINPYELDIYLPELNLAFEFDGLFWHNEINKPDKRYHLTKTTLCEEKGIQLIHIFEDEWHDKKDIVQSRIKSLLGKLSNKIYARKCKIITVDKRTSKEFLSKNHIQGFCNSKINYGLTYNGELVALMTFGNYRKIMGRTKEKDSYELLRFCNKLDTNVIGGASKLFKYFLREHNPKNVISYADRRWSVGNLYNMLGFSKVHNSEPNYFYVIGCKRKNRFIFRKDALVREGFDKDKTEHQIMLERKIYRIYDCGNILFKY